MHRIDGFAVGLHELLDRQLPCLQRRDVTDQQPDTEASLPLATI
jgi:hypothetical protein